MHHGLGHAGIQVRVFTAALGNTAPAGVAGNVQHGRKRPAHALRGGLNGSHAGAFFHQGGVKGGRQAQRNGENGVETVNHVTAHQERNAQPGFLHGNALELVDLRGVHFVEDGADLSLAEGIGILCDVSPGRHLVHLADFLGQGHLRENALHAGLHLVTGTQRTGGLVPVAGEDSKEECHKAQVQDIFHLF